MGTLYTRRLLNDPTVTLNFNHPLGGLLAPSQVALHLSNDDHFFDGVNLRGQRIVYTHFDALTNEMWDGLTGTVVSQEWRVGMVILHTVAHDLSVFQTHLPKEVVTESVFPNADPQQGLGKPIPIIFGTAASANKVNDAWELPWVNDDTDSNIYDYLLGRGTFTDISVYRDTVGERLFLVPPSEYTVNTSAKTGYTLIRFSLRQRNFGGGFHRIFAAANVSGGSRNFATNLQSLLSDSTWGLGLPVNAASFTSAATELMNIGSLFCDGAITTSRAAQDLLTQLMVVRGMSLTLNSSGEYVLAVDVPPPTITGFFGHGLGQSANGLAGEGFEGLETTPKTEAIKTLILDYRVDHWTGKPILSTSPRTVFGYGEELRVLNQFVRDRTTADKIACYMANRHRYGDTRITFRAGQMARLLRPGDVIRYQSMQPTFDDYYMCRTIDRSLTTSRIYAVGWSEAIYPYIAGTLPREPAAHTDTDWSRSTPTAVSGVNVTSSGIETNNQGVKSAYMVVQYAVPDEPWATTVVRYTKSGETLWATLPGENGLGVKQTKIVGLVGDQIYDLRVTRQNALNATLTADQDLTNQTAPGDTTAPSAPTAIAVRQAGGRTVEIDATFSEPSDWGTTILYRNTTNSSATATEIARGKQKRFDDQDVTYGTLYYYWVKVADMSGNLSGFSPSSSHSVTIARLGTNDYGDGQIATSKVADGAITIDGIYVNDSLQGIGTSETVIGTLTVATNGGAVVICGKVAGDIGSGAQVIVKIRKDSVTGTMLDYGYMTEVAGGGSAFMTVSLVGRDLSPAASQTYKLTAIVTGASSSAESVRLYALNRKK